MKIQNDAGRLQALSVESSRPSIVLTAMVGAHTVKIGSNPPIRLDKLETSYIPPLGIRSTTRFANASKGMQVQTKNMLNCLQRTDGSLDAGALLKALNTFDEYSIYQQKNTQTPDNPAMAGVREMAHAVSSMSNQELTAAYGTLLCHDMTDLKNAMTYEAMINPETGERLQQDLNNLRDLEALIAAETSRRAAVANMSDEEAAGIQTLDQMYGHGGDDPQISSHGEKDIQANTMIGSLNHMAISEGRSSGVQKRFNQLTESHRLEATDIRQIGDRLRAADLTINISAPFLFGNARKGQSMPVESEDFHLQNIFDQREHGQTTKSTQYQAFREEVENQMMPNLRNHTAGRERPIYGALNLLNNPLGTCDTYGNASIKLKPRVKQMCTYTFGDTMMIPKVKVTTENKQAFIDKLMTYDTILSDETKTALQDPQSNLSKAIDAFFSADREGTIFDFTHGNSPWEEIKSNLSLKESSSAAQKSYFIQNALFQTCKIPGQLHQAVASYDHIENLLQDMPEATMLNLGITARNNLENCAGIQGAAYIEAQIPKEIGIEDIESITIEGDFYERDEAARIMEWGRQNGIEIKFAGMDADSAFITRNENQSKTMERSVRETRQYAAGQEMNAMLQEYPLDDAVNRYLDTLPDGEALRNLTGDGNFVRGVFRDVVLGKLPKAKDDAWDSSTTGYITKEEFFGKVDARLPGILEKKIALLRAADKLPFDNVEQKKAFANWILESGALSSPDEMVLMYSEMTKNAEILGKLLSSPETCTPENFTRTMMQLHRSNFNIILPYLKSQIAPGDAPMVEQDKLNAAFRRYAFLTIQQLGKSAGGAEKLQALAQLVESQEMKTLQCTAMSLLTSQMGIDFPDQVNEDLAITRTMPIFLHSIVRSVKQATGQTGTAINTSQRVDFQTIPASIRNSYLDMFPEVRPIVDQYMPITTPMRELSNVGAPPPGSFISSFQTRRNFLLGTLKTYGEHDRGFERRTDFHGRTHAVRTFIFANVMSNILRERNINVNIDAVAFATAGHDIAREGAGADHWEGASAEMTGAAVLKLNPDNPPKGEFTNGVMKCITSNQNDAPTMEAYLVHSADSLDFSRIAPLNMRYFPFLREPIVLNGQILHPDDRLRSQLADEAVKLAELTHPMVAARKELQGMLMEANETGSDELLQRYDDQRDAIQDEIEERAMTRTDEQVLENIEGLIRDNPEMFPLLSTYYH